MALTLTKQDLSAIREVVREEIKLEIAPLSKRIDKNFIFLKKRFDDLFDFLDKSYVKVKGEVREIQAHLHLPITDF